MCITKYHRKQDNELGLVLILGHACVQGQARMVLPRPSLPLLDAVKKVPTRPAYKRAEKVADVGYNDPGSAHRMGMQIGSTLPPPS